MREWLSMGRFPVGGGLRVRLPEWDRHFQLHQLYPDLSAAFVLPPVWPFVYSDHRLVGNSTEAKEAIRKLTRSRPVPLLFQIKDPGHGRAHASTPMPTGSFPPVAPPTSLFDEASPSRGHPGGMSVLPPSTPTGQLPAGTQSPALLPTSNGSVWRGAHRNGRTQSPPQSPPEGRRPNADVGLPTEPGGGSRSPSPEPPQPQFLLERLMKEGRQSAEGDQANAVPSGPYLGPKQGGESDQTGLHERGLCQPCPAMENGYPHGRSEDRPDSSGNESPGQEPLSNRASSPVGTLYHGQRLTV